MPLPAHIEKMLERQATLWEKRRELARRESRARIERMGAVDSGPWVTLSNPLGSGGSQLARSLARSLDWQVFDREICELIAEHTHAQKAVLAQLDEKAFGPINDYLSSLFDPRVPGQVPFHRETVRVIWGLAKQGSAVILGRGANWFLDPRGGVRVRVIAPMELRATRIAARDGIDLRAARTKAVERDARQADFIRHVYGHDIADPAGYDLVLNLEHVDQDTAVSLIRTLLAARTARRQEPRSAKVDPI